MFELEKEMVPPCRICGKPITSSPGFSSLESSHDLDSFGVEVPGDASCLIWVWYCEDCDHNTLTLMFYTLDVE